MRLAEFFASVVQFFRRRFARPFLLPILRPLPPQANMAPPNTLITTFILNSQKPALYTMSDGIIRPDRNLPLDDALNLAHQDPIWANRGKAIQSYAMLEQALSRLMGELGSISLQTAVAIFYRITNTGLRTKTLEKLLRNKHGTQFNSFWNPYFKELRQIDTKRAEIAHWLSIMYAALSDTNVMMIGVSLIPPSYTGGEPTERITSSDLIEFSIKCDVFMRLCNMFCAATEAASDMPDEIKTPWLDIFRRPLVYPLPKDHLLFRQPSKPQTPPQSSQA